MPSVRFNGDVIHFPDGMPEDEITDVIYGVADFMAAILETGATIASAAVAEPVSGLAGLATMNPEVIADVQRKMTYTPKTLPGMRALSSLSEEVSNVYKSSGAERAGGYWRNSVVPKLQERLGTEAGSMAAAMGVAILSAGSDIFPVGKAGKIIKRIDPDDWLNKSLEPPHEVRDFAKLKKIKESMDSDGWQGRPVLVYEAGDNLAQSITGSHRIAAAKELGIDVPVKYVDESIFEYTDDLGRGS